MDLLLILGGAVLAVVVIYALNRTNRSKELITVEPPIVKLGPEPVEDKPTSVVVEPVNQPVVEVAGEQPAPKKPRARKPAPKAAPAVKPAPAKKSIKKTK